MHPNDILRAARLELPADAAADITGADPILASKFRAGEAAAAALAACGAPHRTCGNCEAAARSPSPSMCAPPRRRCWASRSSGSTAMRRRAPPPASQLSRSTNAATAAGSTCTAPSRRIAKGTLEILGCGDDRRRHRCRGEALGWTGARRRARGARDLRRHGAHQRRVARASTGPGARAAAGCRDHPHRRRRSAAAAGRRSAARRRPCARPHARARRAGVRPRARRAGRGRAARVVAAPAERRAVRHRHQPRQASPRS